MSVFINKFVGISTAVSHLALLAGVAIGVFLLSGFIRFSTLVAQYDELVAPSADGIVVLTGDNDRIDTGLHLLQQGFAKRVLISGVNPGTSKNAIIRQFASHGEYFSCCVELDRIAKDTLQNSVETAKWVRRHNIKSLVVVTSDYHMPRALLEMSNAMAKIELKPFVAKHASRIKKAGNHDYQFFKILVREYMKTLVASINLVDRSK